MDLLKNLQLDYLLKFKIRSLVVELNCENLDAASLSELAKQSQDIAVFCDQYRSNFVDPAMQQKLYSIFANVTDQLRANCHAVAIRFLSKLPNDLAEDQYSDRLDEVASFTGSIHNMKSFWIYQIKKMIAEYFNVTVNELHTQRVLNGRLAELDDALSSLWDVVSYDNAKTQARKRTDGISSLFALGSHGICYYLSDILPGGRATSASVSVVVTLLTQLYRRNNVPPPTPTSDLETFKQLNQRFIQSIFEKKGSTFVTFLKEQAEIYLKEMQQQGSLQNSLLATLRVGVNASLAYNQAGLWESAKAHAATGFICAVAGGEQTAKRLERETKYLEPRLRRTVYSATNVTLTSPQQQDSSNPTLRRRHAAIAPSN